MKKLLICCLAVVLVLGASACANQTSQPSSQSQSFNQSANDKVAAAAQLEEQTESPADAADATTAADKTLAPIATFSTTKAMKHIKKLTGYGSRYTGSKAEKKGAQYMAAQFKSYGYEVTIQNFKAYGSKKSQNVIATKKGISAQTLIIGGHLDCVKAGPGANDNASGVAVVLELARITAKADVVPTIKFVGFGAEEISGPKSTNHHYGSRYYAKKMSKSALAKTEGMLSLDMVGVGKKLTIRNRAVAARTVEKSLVAYGKKIKQPMTYIRDTSKDGYSDHEAFELRGIPAALLEWSSDPNYHSSKDTYARINKTDIKKTGVLLKGWLEQLTEKKLNALRK